MIDLAGDWSSRMRTASFRGIEFLTESHDSKFGRRLAISEFPGAEESRVEDLGAKAWDGHLSAYFIGKDYDLYRDAFLALLNMSGAAWLTHPWLGDIWVRPKDWSVTESNEQGGMCKISIDFVEGGSEPDIATVDRVDSSYAAITDFGAAAVDDFDPEQLGNISITSFIADIQNNFGALSNVIALVRIPLTWANQVINTIEGIKGDIAELMSIPQLYANAWLSLSNLIGGVNLDGSELDTTTSAALTTSSSELIDTARPLVVSLLARAASKTVLRGQNPDLNIDVKLKRNVIAEAALSARMLVMSAAIIALADYRTEADRDAVLETMKAAIDEVLPTASDEVFEAALTMRATLIEALLAQDLEPESSRDIVAPMPSTVLAHRLKVDEDVFLARNAVRHPLFVQGRIYG